MTIHELIQLVKKHQEGIDTGGFSMLALNELVFVNVYGVHMFTLTLGLEKPIFERNGATSISRTLKMHIERNYDKWFPIVAQLGKQRTIRIFSSYDRFKSWSKEYQQIKGINIQVTDNGAGIMYTRESVPQQWELWDAESVVKRHFTD